MIDLIDDSNDDAAIKSALGIKNDGNFMSIVQYLTLKGARIDSSIKWRSSSRKHIDEKVLKKRSTCVGDGASIWSSRKRRVTEPNLAADMKVFTEALDQSIIGDEARQREEEYFSIGHPMCSVHSISDTNSVVSISDLSFCSSSDSRSSSILATYTVPRATVLSIDIIGFTSACAAMPAGLVGEWVAQFYEHVDAVAAAHGVAKAEVRGDCCICVAGAAGAVPSRAFAAADNDPCADQATRMLAFAAALHAALQTLSAGGAATATRMGIATGEASFLVSDGAVHFVRAQGEAAALAMQMETLAAPGSVHVHHSAALRWAAEARRPPPPTARVGCRDAGREPQRAAVFDCAAGAFSPAEESASAAVAGGRGLRRSASALL